MRVAVLNLGYGYRGDFLGQEDCIGLTTTAREWEHAATMLEDAGVDIVVIRWNSPGGSTREAMQIGCVLRDQFASKFRVIAWVQRAKSAAVLPLLCVRDWCFDEHGVVDGTPGWVGEADCSSFDSLGQTQPDDELQFAEQTCLPQRNRALW